MSESVQRDPQSRPDDVDKDPVDDASGSRAAAARKVSEVSADVLADIDRAMEGNLFEEGEVVTRDEFNKRADIFVKGNVQKGGE